MMKLSSTTKNMLLFFYVVAAFAYVLFWLAQRSSIGFSELISIILMVLIGVWPAIRRRRLNSSRVYVEVCKPDNNSIRLIERK